MKRHIVFSGKNVSQHPISHHGDNMNQCDPWCSLVHAKVASLKKKKRLAKLVLYP